MYHTLGADRISRRAREYNAESMRLVCDFLGREPPDAVRYYKYPDRATREELTGDRGNAFALSDRGEIHTLWEQDRHEIVHILALPWGQPPALLAEGIAVHLSGSWQGQPVREYCQQTLARDQWIPLAALVDTRGFRRHDDLLTYAETGVFVEWILEEYGKETLRELYATLQNTPSDARHRAALEELLGEPIEDLDARVREWLR